MKARGYLKSEVDGRTIYKPVPPEQASHVMINMPGPTGTLILGMTLKGSREEAKSSRGEPIWTWNGDTEKPTLKPSVLTHCGPDGKTVCHSWVGDGKAQFLGDSTHEFGGQTIDLLEVNE